MTATTTLFHVAGATEHAVIAESGDRRFPPVFAHSFFYGTYTMYAALDFASAWNARLDGGCFVCEFRVQSAWLAFNGQRLVWLTEHEEFILDAEDVPALNRAIVGAILVAAWCPPPAIPALDGLRPFASLGGAPAERGRNDGGARSRAATWAGPAQEFRARRSLCATTSTTAVHGTPARGR